MTYLFHDIRFLLFSDTLVHHRNCVATMSEEKVCSEKRLVHKAPELYFILYDTTAKFCHVKVAPNTDIFELPSYEQISVSALYPNTEQKQQFSPG